MKEEKTKSKKSVIYYVILAVCALLIITATVLTVYFVTRKTETVAEKPPVVQPDDPKDPDDPADPDDPVNPDKPSSGDDNVKFVSPVSASTYTMAYAEIVHNETVGWWYRHNAIDFNVAKGTDVYAMADGTVTEVSYAEETGNLIVVDHGDGLKTSYRFVEPVEGLGVGEKVTKGQKIAEVAAAYGTEAYAGEHLHLEMYLGKNPVDPADYVDLVLDKK